MFKRTRVVKYVDSFGIEHAAKVEAESLFEAAVRLVVFCEMTDKQNQQRQARSLARTGSLLAETQWKKIAPLPPKPTDLWLLPLTK